MKKKNIFVGIDLGTTNSLVSYIQDGKPQIIPNERGERSTPSVVSIKNNGEILVGEMAKTQAVLNSDNTVSNVKLSMGKDVKYNIIDKEFSPVDISSLILKNLKENAEKYLNTKIIDTVITVPAYFDDNQRTATQKAAELAGLNVLKLLNEPTAAALSFGFNKKEESRLLTVDLGGGTLDITLMEYKDNKFTVKGIGGSTSIGGNNFDMAIIDFVLEEFKSMHSFDISQDKIAYQQLVIHAEKAKKDLSSANETRIMIPYITIREEGPIHLNISLDLDKFNNLIKTTLGEIEACINDTFEQSGIDKDWVDSIILAGGATRVPAVETIVNSIIKNKNNKNTKKGKPENVNDSLIKRDINPDEAVCLGAGILAGIFEGSIPDMEFCDITSRELGVEDDEGKMVVIIPKGTSYPLSVTHLFTTTQENQDEVIIHVLQDGDNTGNIKDSDQKMVSLGKFHLKVAPNKKEGEPNIDVTFTINMNGILKVSAIDLDSGQAGEIIIRDKQK